MVFLMSWGCNWQYDSIGSDNGLSPVRRQAIIWTNDALGYWRIYASLNLNELKSFLMWDKDSSILQSLYHGCWW